ncbi:MAG: EAL domain-containing protein [Rhodospirillales bacterium]|nr:EAL domain-containing protein [Rhodospirillales bacterium]MCB9995497.1 EAL domain-containing protein [Rhodospirillales bacterium]
MADTKDIKAQRDRFLAFSFASSDLFLEVAEDGGIVYALGAAKSITGIDPASLSGGEWLDMFNEKDRPTLVRMRKRAKEAERCGPFHVRIQDVYGGRDVIVNGIKMPDSDSFYLTVGFPNEMLMKLAEITGEYESQTLLDKDTFLYSAVEAFNLARSLGEDVDITLLDINGAGQIKETLGDEIWRQFTQAVTDILSSNSFDGYAAAAIDDGRYSVIHDKTVDSDTLRNKLESLARQSDPTGEGFSIESKTVSADLQSLSERETTKALIYTINEFERKGTALNIETLNSGFKAYVSANAQKIHQFKTVVEQLSFNFEFQPIVDMETTTLSHFEIVSRFKGEGSTQEWIIFGEDIGMAADFDIAVCERVINYLLYKAANNRMRFAMNLSGQSIQNEQFFKTLTAKLDMNPQLAQRMIFEITESTMITELEMVNSFIRILQSKGYQVCLDDFGAGAGSLQYIQQLDVDFIKIDGQYTRKILGAHRDQVLVKNLSQMCRDLDIRVIAEQIETQEQKDQMLSLGVQMGQGYYYGYPLSKPQFDPEKIPAPAP